MCEGKRVVVYTPLEVSKHCFQDDCWVIIDNRVYDVTEYVPRHPGGAMIYVNAGGDCTQLFECYHVAPARARCASRASQRSIKVHTNQFL
jgi:acyl-lipid (8-3)-desaturase